MSYQKSNREPGQALQYAFNEATGRLKVEMPPQGEPGETALEMDISHTDDSVRLGDGSKLTTATRVGTAVGLDTNVINPVKIDDSTPLSVTTDGSGNLTNHYNEITSIPAGIESTVLSYTVSGLTKALVRKIEVSGTNIATFTIYINNVVQTKKRTYLTGELNATFDLLAGIKLVSGDILLVTALHTRTNVGDFNANTLITEIK